MNEEERETVHKSVQAPLGLRGANSPVLEQPAAASCRLLLTQDRAGIVTPGRRVVAVACCTEGRRRPVHTVHFCLLLSSATGCALPGGEAISPSGSVCTA